jgi:Zn-dependent protease with chaperone function
MELPVDNRLYEIFSDLKKDRIKNGKIINLMNKNRKLVATKNAINFQGDRLKNQINYNPDYFQNHLSKSSDNIIRFVLLHEEAHLTRGKNHILWIFTPLIVVALISCFLMYAPISVQIAIQGFNLKFSSFVFGGLFLIIALLIVIPISWRFLWDSMYDEEINSDLFGAESLVDFFNENNPEKIARELFEQESTDTETKRIKLLVFVMKILGVYPDYHPSNYVRIEIIRKKISKI